MKGRMESVDDGFISDQKIIGTLYSHVEPFWNETKPVLFFLTQKVLPYGYLTARHFFEKNDEV